MNQPSSPLSPAEFEAALKRFLMLVMTVDGEIDPDEVRNLLEIFRLVTGKTIDESDVLDEISELQLQPMDVASFLAKLEPRLDWSQKQNLLRSVLLMSTADHQIQPIELSLVYTTARTMAKTAEELKLLLHGLGIQHQSSGDAS